MEDELSYSLEINYQRDQKSHSKTLHPALRIQDGVDAKKSRYSGNDLSLSQGFGGAEIINTYVQLNSYAKGTGPGLATTVKFYEFCSSVQLNWLIQSNSHNNYKSFLDGITFNGNYQPFSTWTFVLNAGWEFKGGKYAFGQGNYELRRATLAGCNVQDSYPSSEQTVDTFSVSDPLYTSRVFRMIIEDDADDAWSDWETRFGYADDRFDNHVGFHYFDIEFKNRVKSNNWAPGDSGHCEQSGATNDNFFDSLEDGWNAVTGAVWGRREGTDRDNRGYDVLYGITESGRSSIFDPIGQTTQNIAWNAKSKDHFHFWGIATEFGQFLIQY